MKTIDFLPDRYHEQSAQRKNQIWRVVVALLFAGLVGGAAIGQWRIRRRIESECAIVRQQYEAARAAGARFSEVQLKLNEERAHAELTTWLRHPWPRSHLVARALEALPETICVTRLQIRLEEPAVPSVPVSTVSAEAATEETRPAAQRDLERLRNDIDPRETAIFLEGIAADNAALYGFIGELARTDIFTKAELQSVVREESVESAFRFKARLVVRPGIGQPNGPQPAPDTSKDVSAGSLAQKGTP